GAPGHGERDHGSAGKWDLPIVEGVRGGADVQKEAYSGDGVAVNSGPLDGLQTPEAKKKIIGWLEEKHVGKGAVSYRLRDWVFSRQRYWGEPFPVVHCEKDGAVAVPDAQLPVTLPDGDRHDAPGPGQAPLAAIPSWGETACPKCGGPAKRETDTMPNRAGSCWYYLRFMDPTNARAPFDPAREKYWGPVD